MQTGWFDPERPMGRDKRRIVLLLDDPPLSAPAGDVEAALTRIKILIEEAANTWDALEPEAPIEGEVVSEEDVPSPWLEQTLELES